MLFILSLPSLGPWIPPFCAYLLLVKILSNRTYSWLWLHIWESQVTGNFPRIECRLLRECHFCRSTLQRAFPRSLSTTLPSILVLCPLCLSLYDPLLPRRHLTLTQVQSLLGILILNSTNNVGGCGRSAAKSAG